MNNQESIPTPTSMTIIEFPVAALAGFLSAELSTLHGVHPEIVYEAIARAQRALGINIYLNSPPEENIVG